MLLQYLRHVLSVHALFRSHHIGVLLVGLDEKVRILKSLVQSIGYDEKRYSRAFLVKVRLNQLFPSTQSQTTGRLRHRVAPYHSLHRIRSPGTAEVGRGEFDLVNLTELRPRKRDGHISTISRRLQIKAPGYGFTTFLKVVLNSTRNSY